MASKEIFRIDLREAAGRLVHDEHLGRTKEGAGDLDHLLLGDGAGVDRGIEWHIRMIEFGEDAPRFFTAGFAIDPTEARRLGTQEDILFDRKVRREIEFLVNHLDAAAARMKWIARSIPSAVEENFAGIWLIRAAQDFHERAFARAVLADERVNFTRRYVERDAF